MWPSLFAVLVACATCCQASTSFQFTFANIAPYVPTLIDIQCNINSDCNIGLPEVAALIPSDVNQASACFQMRCLESVIVLDALNRGGADYEQLGITRNFCCYGHEIVTIDNAIGAAQRAALQDPTLQTTDARIRGSFARWLPEVYSLLACAIETGPDQCLRGICGRRSDVPGTGLGSAAYQCNAAIDDPVLAAYGHVAYPELPMDAFGRIVFSQDGLKHDGTFAYTRPLFNADAVVFNRTIPYGIAMANSYGLVDHIPSSGDSVLNMCGSPIAQGICAWDDIRGLYMRQDRTCTNFGDSLPPGDVLASTCMLPRCNGAGTCGLPTNIGSPCPLAEVSLGAEFEAAADGGGAAGRNAIDPRCLVESPQCVQRSVSLSGIAPRAGQIALAALSWVEQALQAAETQIINNPGGFPLNLTQATPTIPLQGTSTDSVMLTALGNAVAQSGYGSVAFAVCAFQSATTFLASGTDCSRSTSHVSGPDDPIPSTPECAAALTTGGDVFAYTCFNQFVSSPASISIDIDGILHANPFPITPDFVRVGRCVSLAAPYGTYAPEPPNAPFVPPSPGAVRECTVPLCNGQGQRGWYAREPGSFCGEVRAPLSPFCAERRCTANAECNLTYVPIGTSCRDDNPCTTQETCDGAGQCNGGVDTPGCVPCTVDEDCVCTGGGGLVGWCRGGKCTAQALTAPEALSLLRGDYNAFSLPPFELGVPEVDDWEGSPSLAMEDHGPSISFFQATGGRLPRVCRMPAREIARFSSEAGAPCYATVPAIGLCRANGVCGPPAPLLRWVLKPGVNASTLPCNTDSTNCTLRWAYEHWFAPPGAEYSRTSICGGVMACVNHTNATVAAGVPPTMAAFTVTAEPAGTPCVPTALELSARADEVCVINASGWECTGGSANVCSPPVISDEAGCDQSRLFYASSESPSAQSQVDASLFLPNPQTYGPCILPAQCDPVTGLCKLGFAPAGVWCPGLCGGWPPGVCDAAGHCLRTGGATSGLCQTNNSCLYAFCPTYARLDGPLGILDRPPGPASQCATIPVELIPGGSPNALPSGSVLCADNSSCTVGDVCDAAGSCQSGDQLDCVTAVNTCLVTQGCSPTFGRCLAQQLPVGSSCAPSAFCGTNGTCDANATCVTSTIRCPPITSSASVQCSQISGICAAIVGFTRQPSSPSGAFATVNVPAPTGGVSVVVIVSSLAEIETLLATVTVGAAGVMLSITGEVVGSFDPMLPPFAPPSSYGGVCVYTHLGVNAPCDLVPPEDICGTGGVCVEGMCVPTGTKTCTTGNVTFCNASVGVCSVPDGGCVYPLLPEGTTCGFAVPPGSCLAGFTCTAQGACVGHDRGCTQVLPDCLEYVPATVCATGCNTTIVADGTPCSCLSGTCTGSCSSGTCVLSGVSTPPPSPEDIQRFFDSIQGTNDTGRVSAVQKTNMLLLSILTVVLVLILICACSLFLYEICLLNRSITEPIFLREMCILVFALIIGFVAVILFVWIYLNA